MTGLMKGIRQAVAEAVFPGICLACRTFIGPAAANPEAVNPVFSTDEPAESVFGHMMKNHLCKNCRDEFVPIVPPVCYRCGRSFATRCGNDHLCGDCISHSRPFAAARALGEYDGPLMKLVHTYKYMGKLQLAGPLGAMLLNGYMRYFSESGIDCMVPVPLHRKKLRMRGFNQVILMLDHWKKLLKTVRPSFALPEIADPMVRTRYTDSQTGLDKKERWKNVRDAFAVTRTECIEGRRVLLVDDVYTTGATLEECARVLSRAGAEAIFVLTIARTM